MGSSLQMMEQTAHTSLMANSPSFAGLLASLASRQQDAARRDDSRNSDGLVDDVVTLSYDPAIRSRTRDRTVKRGSDRNATAARREGWEKLTVYEVAEPGPEGVSGGPSAKDQMRLACARELRTTCVTIWMTKAERAQLRRRAVEARLTISAYLRSCALEADTLRAQVKTALAELKTGTKTEEATRPSQKPWAGLIERMIRRKP
jgi:hypothetical protein